MTSSHAAPETAPPPRPLPSQRPPPLRAPLRIAMVGLRGVPATYGGIEHHVEELGSRLAERGHHVTVFCRTNYTETNVPTYRGMRLRHLPTAGTKHLDAIAHSALSSVAALRGFDVVHYHALGPGLVAPLPRYLSSARVVLTVHGLDGERAKWGGAARRVLQTAEWMSARVPHATITVSRDLARHYALVHSRAATYIPNGVVPPQMRRADAITREFGLTPGSYLLFMGRMVPEKAPDLLLSAFRQVATQTRLVLAGGSSFTDEYLTQLQALAAQDPRVILPGYVYGDVKAELYSNAAAFVLPSSLEGLPLTLLEAASFGTPVIASDIPPHLEVLGEERAGQRLFPSGDRDALAAAIRRSLTDPPAERMAAASLRDRVLEEYRWESVADSTEMLYQRLVSREPACSA